MKYPQLLNTVWLVIQCARCGKLTSPILFVDYLKWRMVFRSFTVQSIIATYNHILLNVQGELLCDKLMLMMIIDGVHVEKSCVYEHQLLPTVSSDAACQVTCSRREHTNFAVDVHKIVSGCHSIRLVQRVCIVHFYLFSAPFLLLSRAQCQSSKYIAFQEAF